MLYLAGSDVARRVGISVGRRFIRSTLLRTIASSETGLGRADVIAGEDERIQAIRQRQTAKKEAKLVMVDY